MPLKKRMFRWNMTILFTALFSLMVIILAVLVLSALGGLLGVEVSTPLGQALDRLSSPAVLVVLAGITGLLLARLSGKQKRGGEEK